MTSALKVLDRSKVISDIYGNGFTISADANITGNARSLANGSLGDRATISANATLHGVLTGNRAGVKGTLLEHATVATQSLIARTITSSGTNTEVPKDGTASLPPGNYGTLIVRTGGSLALSATGIYRFVSVLFEPDTKLMVAPGHTAIAVQGALTLGDRFLLAGGGDVDLFAGGSSVTIGHNAILAADLEAPAANVDIQDRAYMSGCVGGKNVTVNQDVNLGNGVAAPPPVTASLAVTGDWGGDYCTNIKVTNLSASTIGWIVTLNTKQSTIYNTWNGAFSGTFGTVTATPNQPSNMTLGPGQTTTSVGFCAHRNAPGAMATIVSASKK